MRYIEVIATVRAGDAERAADVLRDLAGGGAWIDRPFVQLDLESDATALDDAPVRVHVYVRDGATVDDLARAALSRARIEGSLEARAVDEEDWAESWKEHFHPERFGERLVVVPSWREFAPAPDDVVITLDPGMAFGTGQHETTRMCLEALERHVRPGATILDVGCGSGILSVAAAKLGAAAVTALDIDADCVRITRENARINGVCETVHAAEGSAGSSWPLAQSAARAYDVVVANIIARVIVDLASSLAAALRDGTSRLIVSGIIAEREGETIAALAAAGLRISTVRALGEWRCIEAVRA